MTRSFVAICFATAAAFGAAGCQDPCIALAERICNCEASSLERQSCRQDRITSQQNNLEISDDDRSRCTAALDTCNCTALDENRLEACGFVPEDG